MDLRTTPFLVGKWTVDPVARELLDGDRRVEIEPKLIDVLTVLAVRAGDVVSKDELIKEVWGDRHVSDSPVANAVYRLRKQLCDSSDRPDYIQTVHGKGYRLLCDVTLPDPGPAGGTHADPTAQPAAHASTTTESRPRKGRWPGAVLVVLGLVAVGVVAALTLAQRQRGPVGPIPIAALPFENLDASGNQRLGRDVARDTLAQLIKGAPHLAVISDSVSFPQLNKGLDVVGVGKEIGARFVIDGTITITPQQITVYVSLINTDKRQKTRGLLHASDQFSAAPDEINELGPRIAAAIASWLGTRERTVEATPTITPDTASAEASQRYYAGIEFLKRTNEESNLRRAIRWLEGALEVDPRYAAALAGSCEAHLRLHIVTSERSLYDKAVERCNFAEFLDPSLVQTKLAMGTLAREGGKLDESLMRLQALLAEQPGNVDALVELADTLAQLGRAADAEATVREAVALQRGNWESYSALGMILYDKGEYEQALQHYQWVTELMPESAIALANVGVSYYALGDTANAKAALDASIAREPLGYALLSRGIIAYYDADFDEAAKDYEEAIALGEEDYWVWGLLAEASRYVTTRQERVRDLLETAKELVEQRLVLKPSDTLALAQLALYQARLGDFDAAHERILLAKEQSPQDMDVLQIEAAIWAEQGNAEQACARLRETLALGFERRLIERDPDFKPYLARDPNCL